jgi:type IV pilus assembly protein PilB
MSSRIGELLVKNGLITPEQLIQAQGAQHQQGGLLVSQFVKLGFLSEETVSGILSEQYGLQIVELDGFAIEDQTINLIPRELATKHLLVPLVIKDRALTVAMADPSNIVAINDIKFITGYDIQVVLATESDIKATHEKFYESKVAYDSIIGDMGDTDVQVVDEKRGCRPSRA